MKKYNNLQKIETYTIMVQHLNQQDNLQNNENHPDNNIHFPIIKGFVSRWEQCNLKQEKIIIAHELIDYLLQNTNWVLAQPRLTNTLINKLKEFIFQCYDNPQFVNRCNILLQSLGEPAYNPPFIIIHVDDEDQDSDVDDDNEESDLDNEDDNEDNIVVFGIM